MGDSPLMEQVRKLISKVAPTDSTVLVLGETGTGKELVARALHDQSLRRDMPFVAINCGALPESLIESELFGHRRGSFTGADEHRVGLFEVANGGTLFLDEIGELAQVHASQAAAVFGKRRDSPRGRERIAHGRRARDLRHAPASGADGRRGRVSRRFDVPHQHVRNPFAGAARAERRYRQLARPPDARDCARAVRPQDELFTPEALRVLPSTPGRATCASWPT